MGKVAKLVYASLVVRVIVDDNASEEEILAIAIPKLSSTVTNFI